MQHSAACVYVAVADGLTRFSADNSKRMGHRMLTKELIKNAETLTYVTTAKAFDGITTNLEWLTSNTATGCLAFLNRVLAHLEQRHAEDDRRTLRSRLRWGVGPKLSFKDFCRTATPMAKTFVRVGKAIPPAGLSHRLFRYE